MATLQHMIIQSYHQVRSWFGVITILCSACVNLFSAAAPAAPAAPAVTNTPPAEIQIPESKFTDDAKDRNARDPFFPLSTRRKEKEEVAQAPKTVTQVKVTTADSFTVNAITGNKNRRIAIINKTIFEVGNEFRVTTADGTSTVKCWEIRPNSVIISVDGRPERLEIHLKASTFNIPK